VKNANIVEFKRLDELPEFIEEAVIAISDHFRSRRDYVPDFCRLLSISKKWNKNNLSSKLEFWCDQFGQRKGRGKLIGFIKKAFESCENDKEIHKLRGALLESLVIASYGGPSILQNRKKYGWGAQVFINSNDVKYWCTSSPRDEGCEHRSTVDFGYWDGYNGKFFECKILPDSIGCKEVQFMKTLHLDLTSAGISFEIFFVSAYDQDAVRLRLEQLNATSLYKPLGYKELMKLMPA
jgi:hypothetical protein